MKLSSGRKARLILLLTAILILASVFAPAVQAKSKIICDYCKQQILGHYIESGGKYYHPIHFLCDNCGSPIDPAKYYLKNGKNYCPDCYKKLFAPKCAYCGEILEDGHIVADGKTYHDSCYYNHVALRCALCGKIITGNYLTDFWGNVYHEEHKDDYFRCDYCSRLISDKLTGGSELYSDGRRICGICLKSVVTDMEQAMEIFKKVKLHLSAVGIWVDDSDVTLHLVNRDELAKISQIDNDGNQGFIQFRETTGADGKKIRIYNIYILDSIPEMSFVSVAAHELMHVWQYINAVPDNNQALCEGSSNYASYLVLQHFPDKMAEYLIETIVRDTSAVYGDGFRRVQKLVNDHGAAFWLRHLKSHSDFPSGY